MATDAIFDRQGRTDEAMKMRHLVQWLGDRREALPKPWKPAEGRQSSSWEALVSLAWRFHETRWLPRLFIALVFFSWFLKNRAGDRVFFESIMVLTGILLATSTASALPGENLLRLIPLAARDLTRAWLRLVLHGVGFIGLVLLILTALSPLGIWGPGDFRTHLGAVFLGFCVFLAAALLCLAMSIPVASSAGGLSVYRVSLLMGQGLMLLLCRWTLAAAPDLDDGTRLWGQVATATMALGLALWALNRQLRAVERLDVSGFSGLRLVSKVAVVVGGLVWLVLDGLGPPTLASFLVLALLIVGQVLYLWDARSQRRTLMLRSLDGLFLLGFVGVELLELDEGLSPVGSSWIQLGILSLWFVCQNLTDVKVAPTGVASASRRPGTAADVGLWGWVWRAIDRPMARYRGAVSKLTRRRLLWMILAGLWAWWAEFPIAGHRLDWHMVVVAIVMGFGVSTSTPTTSLLCTLPVRSFEIYTMRLRSALDRWFLVVGAILGVWFVRAGVLRQEGFEFTAARLAQAAGYTLLLALVLVLVVTLGIPRGRREATLSNDWRLIAVVLLGVALSCLTLTASLAPSNPWAAIFQGWVVLLLLLPTATALWTQWRSSTSNGAVCPPPLGDDGQPREELNVGDAAIVFAYLAFLGAGGVVFAWALLECAALVWFFDLRATTNRTRFGFEPSRLVRGIAALSVLSFLVIEVWVVTNPAALVPLIGTYLGIACAWFALQTGLEVRRFAAADVRERNPS